MVLNSCERASIICKLNNGTQIYFDYLLEEFKSFNLFYSSTKNIMLWFAMEYPSLFHSLWVVHGDSNRLKFFTNYKLPTWEKLCCVCVWLMGDGGFVLVAYCVLVRTYTFCSRTQIVAIQKIIFFIHLNFNCTKILQLCFMIYNKEHSLIVIGPYKQSLRSNLMEG